MKMNTQFTVAIHTMMLIMINPDRKMTSEMISESTGANPVLIRQIFGKLKTAGLLQISTGRGITKLAKAPDEINLWDVYTAVEGDHADELFTFHQNISKECRVGCSFKEILNHHVDKALRAMKDELSAVSLEQLLREWDAIK